MSSSITQAGCGRKACIIRALKRLCTKLEKKPLLSIICQMILTKSPTEKLSGLLQSETGQALEDPGSSLRDFFFTREPDFQFPGQTVKGSKADFSEYFV